MRKMYKCIATKFNEAYEKSRRAAQLYCGKYRQALFLMLKYLVYQNDF